MTLNVVIFSHGNDTGGQGYRLKRAFDRYYPDEFKVRSIHSSDSYFQYPMDIPYTPRIATGLFAEADIIHMRNGLEGLKRLRPDAYDGKVGLVCHWHGSRFRSEHKRLFPEVASTGAIQLVSTVDLGILESGLTWLPSPVDMAEMEVLVHASGHQTEGKPIRVVHAPTDRKIKATAELIKAITDLSVRLPIELDLIERKPWREVLVRKAKGDIYMDQLDLGYGNNSLEAWALGLPVVAGVADPWVRNVMLQIFGDIPFFESSRKNLARDLEDLATDRDLRAQWAALGYDHVKRFHEEKVVVDQLAGIYRMAYERKVANAHG